ncbi:MAG: hypothetical protein P4M13_00020 [Alphaproteobacteria bacterium]|nr:hypothetical protein [Alphaproteobacteria bacterium]
MFVSRSLLKSTELFLKAAVPVLLALVLILQIASLRGLFADNAFRLVRLLQSQAYVPNPEKTRFFCTLIFQLPALITVRLGVTDLAFFRYLFAGTFVALPLGVWALALWKARRETLFWLMLSLFCFVYFTTEFFNAGEYNWAYGLSGLQFVWLIRKAPLSATDRMGLLTTAFLSILSYASTMFFGPLFVALAALRLKESAKNERGFWIAVIVLSAAAALVGLWGFVFPGDPSNKAQALKISNFFENPQIALLGAAFLLSAALLMPYLRSARPALVFCALLIALAAAAGLFRPLNPNLIYGARVWVCAGFWTGCLFIAILLRRRAVYASFAPWQGIVLTFLLFAALCAWDIKDSLDYARYIERFTTIVNANTGFITNDLLVDTDPYALRFEWIWCYPAMSLVLRKNAQAAIMLNSAYGVPKQMMDPYTDLPDLGRYY